MAFIAATATCDQLKLEGLRLLQVRVGLKIGVVVILREIAFSN